MKIGILTQCLNHTHTGVGYAVLSMIEGLKQEGTHELTCFHSPSPFHPLFPHLKHYSFRPLPKIPFAQPLAALMHSHCFNGMDLLHFPVPGIVYGKLPKVPYVMTVHDLIPLKMPEFFPRATSLYMRYCLPRYLKHARFVIAVSEQTKRDLMTELKIPEEKIRVVYSALLEKKQEISFQKEPYILYIGSFDPRKNVANILRGFARLKARGFPHRLILVGRESRRHKSEIPRELIASLNLQEATDIRGYVTEVEKEALLQKAACFVWPSLYEGFGLPLLEAMRLGAPIVTAHNSSIPEVVGEAAYFVDPLDPESIAKGMEAVLSSPEGYVLKGLKKADSFSLSRTGRGYLSVYEEALS